jgi:urea transporter
VEVLIIKSLRGEAASFFRGFSLIMLQERPITGFLFLLGIAVNSWGMLLGAVVGALSGGVGARLFVPHAHRTSWDIYAFNSALVGIAVVYFYSLTLMSLGALVIGSLTSCWIMAKMKRLTELQPYTAPFVISMWCIFLLAPLFGVDAGVESGPADARSFGSTVAVSVGQVMFQENEWSGLLFVIGLLVCSWRAAIWALIGAVLGLVIARCAGFSEDLALAGFFGFNASLAAIALSGRFPGKFIEPLVGVILTVLMTRGFQQIGVPPLTAPFVLSCWLLNMTLRPDFKKVWGQ